MSTSAKVLIDTTEDLKQWSSRVVAQRRAERANAQRNAGTGAPSARLTPKQMKDASDIATRFYEDRKSWEPTKAAESLRKEARRLHDQSMQVGRGEIGGLPEVWRFAASMLIIQAEHLDARDTDDATKNLLVRQELKQRDRRLAAEPAPHSAFGSFS
jgi:hypothetical protein